MAFAKVNQLFYHLNLAQMAKESVTPSQNPASEEEQSKSIIGITIGDINGINFELIFKTFSDERVLNYCTPIIYASTRVANYHKKTLGFSNFQFNVIKSAEKAQPNRVNLINAWQEEARVQLGHIKPEAGEFARKALDACINDLSMGLLDAMVTGPTHKQTFADTTAAGHTEYLQAYFNTPDTLMLMTHDQLKVGLVTTHIPLKQVDEAISQEAITQKLHRLNDTLVKDYQINKPKIAVLGLNPHAGDQGMIGSEEDNTITPAIEEACNNDLKAFGPFPADGFFGSKHFHHFDAILAMYHDQGLIPFKALTFGEGVNYTAGLPVVRTSPDHGPGYALAGKNQADEGSFREAVFHAVKLFKNREAYARMTANPLTNKALNKEPEHS